MSEKRTYASPTAFRRALTDRLKAMGEQGAWFLPALQRQFAYDRLLARLYLVDDGWVVKGATALLARGIGVRGTRDIDIFRMEALAVAEADLRRAADLDLGDWCRFEAGPSRAATQGAKGLRIPIKMYIGTTEWAVFSVDLVGEQVAMTGEPDEVPPLARVAIPDVEQRGYRAYPLVDHVADKVVATFDRYGSGDLPSTRYKDLLDLVAIVRAAVIDAAAQAAALTSQAARRGVRLPDRFDVPDRSCGDRATRARHGSRSRLCQPRSTMRSRSSDRSSTRCSTGAPPGGGTHTCDSGSTEPHDRVTRRDPSDEWHAGGKRVHAGSPSTASAQDFGGLVN
jgi:Nucleotidyl transferase AbiEii toxin, Type IV TA system